jgi:hypothetical protein
MKESLIKAVMKVKGCDRHEAIRIILVDANEWERKRLTMGSGR